MIKLFQKLFFLLFFSSLSSITLAETDKGKELVLSFVGNNGIIVEEFNSLGTLKGYVVKRDAQSAPMLVYADKNGEFIIDGTIYNKDKQDISSNDKQKFIFAKLAPQAMSDIKNTGHVVQTKKDSPIKHALTVVFEPNCIACHMLYQTLQPFIQSGDVSVRWVMVVFLKPSSMGRAASILQSNDPSSSLQTNENNFNKEKEEGGVAEASNITPETKNKITASNKFMQSIGFNGTPAIVYYDAAGKLQFVEGVPSKEAMGDIIKNAGNKFD